MIKTMCHFCKWAKWSKDEQTGCELGRLKKFKQRGAEVTFKDCDKSYEINRFCNANRDQNWTGDLEQELRVKHAIIAIDKDETSYEVKFNTMAKFIDHICKFEVLPTEIVICSSTYMIGNNLRNYWNKLSTLLTDKIKLTIVHSMSNQDSDMVNYAVNKTNSNFYSVHSLADKPKTNLVKKLNFAINEELYTINMISDEPKVFNTYVHKALGGNSLQSLEDKIKDTEKEHKTSTIYTWKKVCKNYQK